MVRYSPFIISVIVILVALFAQKLHLLSQKVFSVAGIRRSTGSTTTSTRNLFSQTMFSTVAGATAAATASSLLDESKPKTPVFFLSHGGPTFMYPKVDFGGEPGAWKKTKDIGKFIKNEIKPNFIIYVSAHWQSSGSELVEIAVPKPITQASKNPNLIDPEVENELIYDFYGFPDHMYKEQFHSKVDLALANDIKATFEANNIKSKLTERGIDHGVWVPGKVAFSTNKAPDSKWDVDVPLIQVSLTSSDDFDFHYKMGEILSKYRSLGGLIICSGMTVHNLRDIGKASMAGKPLPYIAEFHKELTPIVTGSAKDERLSNFNNLKKQHKKLLYSAHPTLEHFMPIVVAAGASYNETARELYNAATLSLGWGTYAFGDYENLQQKL